MFTSVILWHFHIANCMIIFCFFLTFLPLGEIRILSFPKARTILINGAVKKGERLVPPSALEVLMRVTFPAPSLRIKVGSAVEYLLYTWSNIYCKVGVWENCNLCFTQATERFEAIYPILKEVALAGSSGSKAMKQVAQHILTIAIKAAGEGLINSSRPPFWWSLKVELYLIKLCNDNILQAFLTYQGRQVIFLYGLWLRILSVTSNGWALSASLWSFICPLRLCVMLNIVAASQNIFKLLNRICFIWIILKQVLLSWESCPMNGRSTLLKILRVTVWGKL